MNLANWLSVSRIILIPLLLILLPKSESSVFMTLLNFSIFLLLAFTDFLDGYAARKLNIETDLGKLLDPLADKVLVISVFMFYVGIGTINYIWILLVIVRELLVMGLRSLAASKNIIIKADIYGKAKTVWQYITICWLILGLPFVDIFVFLMAITTVLSGFNYFWTNREVLKDA